MNNLYTKHETRNTGYVSRFAYHVLRILKGGDIN